MDFLWTIINISPCFYHVPFLCWHCREIEVACLPTVFVLSFYVLLFTVFVLQCYLGEILHKVVFFFLLLHETSEEHFFFGGGDNFLSLGLPVFNLVRANKILTRFDTSVLIGQQISYVMKKYHKANHNLPGGRKWPEMYCVHSTLVLFQTYFIT